MAAVNESQDSQAIFDAHQALFGIASIGSSPGSARVAYFNSRAPGPLTVAVQDAGVLGCMPDSQGKKKSQAETPLLQIAHADNEHPAVDSRPLNQGLSTAPVLGLKERLLPLPPTATAAGTTPRMDTSQQTPTQVNEDRDYHVFYGPIPSSPANKSTQHNADDEPRTLNEGDTGAVNFGNLSDIARPSSQVSEDGGLDTTRGGGWRANDRTSQLQSHPAQTPYRRNALPHETPALSKNPFSTRSAISAPLAGSQLFGQTQQPSSAVKISPTSSRPSPNVLINSISPNIMETSPLKNRANVSSPTNIQTSSPQRLDQVPGTLLIKDKAGHVVREHSPARDNFSKDELIPESPTDRTPKPSVSRQPLAQYEPMKQSQQRKSSGGAPHMDLQSDNEYDEAFQKAERRKRAERKRAKAAEEMEKVSFARGSRRGSGEQPSKKKQRIHHVQDDTAGPTAMAIKAKSPERIFARTSPKATAPTPETPAVESIKATPAQSAALPETDQDEETRVHDCIAPEPTAEEMIPATSPVPSTKGSQVGGPCVSESELPTLTGSGADEGGNDQVMGETSSLPPPRRRTRKTCKVRRNPFPSSSTSEALPAEPTGKTEHAASTLESPTSTASTAHPGAAAASVAHQDAAGVEAKGEQQARRETLPSPTRPRGQEPATPLQKRTRTAVIAPPSSSLTTLSATPPLLVKETPVTQRSLAHQRPASLNMSPSTSSRNLRRRATRIVHSSESPQPYSRATKLLRRSMKLDSDSTDELHQSPPPSALDKSAAYLKSGRSFRQSIGSSHRGRRLFDNMAFALSSQSDKPEQQRIKLESQIVQAGGSILKDGFQELFEPSSIMNSTSAAHDEDEALRLPRASSSYGFTALIADGHSRKPKYMQALALGLPCLGHQWISACLGKGELVDWEPYLLCAGSSAVLGNAMRSRTLVPYAAADARLAEVIEHRRKLLGGQSILVLLDAKKGRKETKQQYVFLVQALGPCAISKTSTARQAREVLRERQQAGRPFDWLYVDKSCGSVESVLSPPAPARGSGSRKRKKTGASAAAMGGLRVLTDEVVIQSLILGRMVEAGEMEF